MSNAHDVFQWQGTGTILYFFDLLPPLGPLSLGHPQDLHVREILINLWTNFASTWWVTHCAPPFNDVWLNKGSKIRHLTWILTTLSGRNPTINGTLGFSWTPLVPQGPLRYLSLSSSPTMQPIDSQVMADHHPVPLERSHSSTELGPKKYPWSCPHLTPSL